MKKLALIGIAMLMVMSLAVAASADGIVVDTDIKIGLQFWANGTLAQGPCVVGTVEGGHDGFYLGEDTTFGAPVNGKGEIICYNLSSERWANDLRAPITTPHTCKAWNLKAYINGGGLGTCRLDAWVGATGKLDSPDYKAELYEGTWTAQQCLNGQAGTPIWSAPHNSSGSSSSPQYSQSPIPMGLNQDKYYTVAIMTVPEPGSMVALFSGLVGLVGFGIRRRK